MAALSLSLEATKPLNRWDYSSIRPGNVGSVGDCLITPRLKSSLPGDFQWDREYYGKNEALYGSSTNNGTKLSFNSGGGPARTKDSNWGGRRSFKISHGWIYQDMRAPDKRVEPQMGALPQYSWRNKIAEVNHARTTGNLFPIPAGGLIRSSGQTRGGQYPRVTDVVSGDTTPAFANVNESNPYGQPTGDSAGYRPGLSSFGGPAAPAEQENRQRAQGRSGISGRMR
jgi:hypothetical protein